MHNAKRLSELHFKQSKTLSDYREATNDEIKSLLLDLYIGYSKEVFILLKLENLNEDDVLKQVFGKKEATND